MDPETTFHPLSMEAAVPATATHGATPVKNVAFV